MPRQDTVTFELQEGVLVGTIACSQLDLAAIGQVRQALQVARARNVHKPVILDLSQVQRCSSLVMGALLEMLQQMSQQQRRFVLVGLNQHIRGSFAVTRIDQLFDIHDDVAGALQALSQDAWCR